MTQATRAYVRTQNETASKERTVSLLFEAAMRHVRTAAAALERKDRAAAAPALGKAIDIVAYLHDTLDASQAPALCQQLADIYRFVLGRLTVAQAAADPRPARDAEQALAPVAEAFCEAVRTVAAGAPAR